MNSIRITPLLLYLTTIECLGSFAFFGFQSLFILFLIHHSLYTDKEAYLIWKNFASLTFVMAPICGWIGSRLTSYRIATCVGMWLNTAGYFVLFASSALTSITLSLGLGLIAIGTGFAVTNARNVYGFKNQNPHARYHGYTVYHLGKNIGQVLGPLILGFGLGISTNSFFVITLLASFFATMMFTLQQSRIRQSQIEQGVEKERHHSSAYFLGIAVLLTLLTQYGQYADLAICYLLIAVSFSLVGLLLIRRRLTTVEQNSLDHLLGLLLVFFVAEICQRQSFSLLPVFIDHFVARTYWHYTIPVGVILSIGPLFVIFLIPCFLKIWKKSGVDPAKSFIKNQSVSELTLFQIGISIFSVAFLILASIGYAYQNEVPLYWIIFVFFLFAIADLLTIPIAIAAVVAYSPNEWRGYLMGCLYLCVSASGYFSGLLGQKISPIHEPVHLISHYSLAFLVITAICLMTVIMMMVSHRSVSHSK